MTHAHFTPVVEIGMVRGADASRKDPGLDLRDANFASSILGGEKRGPLPANRTARGALSMAKSAWKGLPVFPEPEVFVTKYRIAEDLTK
jgi:hypothetical protein